MLLGLRSLWEEQAAGVVTGTMAVTAAPGTCAAVGTQSAVPEEERLDIGGKTRKEPRPPRIAYWDDQYMLPVVPPKEPPIVINGAAASLAPRARTAAFARMVFPGRSAVDASPGRGFARGLQNTDAVDRDEAFWELLLAA